MDNIALGQALQGKTGSGQSAWVNPSQAINLGFMGGSFIPGIGSLASLGSALYGGIKGAQGLTSQQASTVGSMLNPTNPGLLQQAGNWIGSQFASNPQLPLSAGTGPNIQSSSSSMQGGAPMALNPNGTPSAEQLHWLNALPRLAYGSNGGSAGGGGVGYAPGADFMTGFGSQGGGYEGGGSYPGLRTLVR